MNKRLSFLFTLLLSINAIPLQAVSPDLPRELALYIPLIGSLEGPIIWAAMEKIHEGKEFWQTIKNPKLWLWHAAISVGVASVFYYIAQKYTPKNKFAWAFKIKERVETNQLMVHRNDNNDVVKDIIAQLESRDCKRYPFMNAIHILYHQFKMLDAAYTCIVRAPEDVPEDEIFKQECEKLAEDLDDLMVQIEELVSRIITTKQWFQEVTGKDPKEFVYSSTYIPLKLQDSLKWAARLKRIKSIYFIGFLTFDKKFLLSLSDWEAA